MEPHTLLTIPGAVPFKCRYMERVVFGAAGKERSGAAAVATHKSFVSWLRLCADEDDGDDDEETSPDRVLCWRGFWWNKENRIDDG